jgi:hypothetical protein
MEQSELRIGNFYSQFGNITQVDWSTLKELEDGPIDQIWCKPIPLTEEWLLKFGFKNNRLGLFDCIKVVEDIGFHIYFIQRHLKEVQYVHQLQNLYFALVGEELTFKNK